MKSLHQRELVLILACLHFTKSSLAAGGQIRLNGSESRCSGRVEIFFNSTWGTVCDDGWDMLDAEVVCRELNCGQALGAPEGSFFGAGEGPIWLDDVNCSGDERSLIDCNHRGFGTHNCGHSEDAGVICSDVQIRLNGSESRCSGRVEIFLNSTWGTVCDDEWDLMDAEVVCRELNCGKALEAPGGSSFGAGEGPIWLDDLGCSGGERSLIECSHRGFGTHDCSHSEDAGVICSGVHIRLNGSESRCSGRVEIFLNGTVGTICDDGWDMLDAEVVCRELNCGMALEALGGSSFGAGEGPIWLDAVGCSGAERSLTDCSHRGFGTHDCSHSEDAGVICSGVQIRLNGSESSCSGRVEIFFNSTWGTVCDDRWDLLDAEVVCRELNCGKALEAPEGSSFGEGEGPIWLDDVNCAGSERSLTDCRHSGFGTHNCGHSEDAGVICSGSERAFTNCGDSGFGIHNCDHIEEADVLHSVSSLPLVYEITRILLLLIMVSVVLFVVCKKKRQANQHVTAKAKYQSNNDERNYVNMVLVDTEKNLEEEMEIEDYENIPEVSERYNNHGSEAGQ